MNDGLGFEIVQIMLKADTCDELDEAIRIVNKTYPVLRGHLEVLDGQHKMVKDHIEEYTKDD